MRVVRQTLPRISCHPLPGVRAETVYLRRRSAATPNKAAVSSPMADGSGT
jgi:hypothetical protein